jgi:hypothetical protein
MRAGASFRHDAGNDPLQGTWCRCSSKLFELRVGPNYERYKQKSASDDALMDLVGVESVDTICASIEILLISILFFFSIVLFSVMAKSTTLVQK